MFTDRRFHSFVKYLSPVYYTPSAKLRTKRAKLSKTQCLVPRSLAAGLGWQGRGGLASSKQEELSGHRGGGVPGAQPT